MYGNSVNKELEGKLSKLKEVIRDYGSLAVGFSGGVDSTFLIAVAKEVLGDKAIAVTELCEVVPAREQDEAVSFCKEKGIKHFFCRYNPFVEYEFRLNGKDRCYVCKKGIFTAIKRIALENGIKYVAEGSNMDDLGDYRPGMRAIEELGIKSPLREAGLYKDDIRELSKAMGLSTFSKPSYACLASRFVYGEEITKEKLRMIEEAEQFLIDRGFLEERVRLHGNLARIEVPSKDIVRLASDDVRKEIYDKLKEIGFKFVTLDLKGYSVGSMNATIGDNNG